MCIRRYRKGLSGLAGNYYSRTTSIAPQKALSEPNFYSCYALPSLEMDKFTDLIDRLIENARERSPVVIAGDFNAWATVWGSKWTNRRGNELLDAMACLDVILLNTGDVPGDI